MPSADITEHGIVDQAPAYIVNMPSEGQGVLIAPQWILTVAHVISPGGRGKTLLIAGKEHKISVRYPLAVRLAGQWQTRNP
jgi:hypothetical protein